MLTYLRQTIRDFDTEIATRPPQKHLFPFCCFRPWTMGPDFIQKCWYGITSYIIIMPLTTVVAIICSATGTCDVQ
jgi:hypothetical protein